MSTITITLPLPPRVLSPNSRAHWAKVAKAKAKYRADARVMTIHAMYMKRNHGKRTNIFRNLLNASEHTTFYFAQNRRRDRDNFSAMLKAARDGIVDAGLLADDSGLVQHPVKFEIDKENPRVEMEIRKIESANEQAREVGSR